MWFRYLMQTNLGNLNIQVNWQIKIVLDNQILAMHWQVMGDIDISVTYVLVLQIKSQHVTLHQKFLKTTTYFRRRKGEKLKLRVCLLVESRVLCPISFSNKTLVLHFLWKIWKTCSSISNKKSFSNSKW